MRKGNTVLCQLASNGFWKRLFYPGSFSKTTTSKAIKQLRPNPFAEFELRVGDLRVLYNVDQDEVLVLLVGRKAGNRLIVEGEEFDGHQDNSTESSGNGIEPDVE